MAQNSGIEWTDHTFNPWIGCTKISSGCTNCYAEYLRDQRFKKNEWGPQGVRVRTSGNNWKKPLAWDRQAGKAGIRQNVFCASLADVFETGSGQNAQMHSWRFELFSLIEATPNLNWLLLTKRPELVSWLIERSIIRMSAEEWLNKNKHVWIGTSAENQTMMDERSYVLKRIPTPNKFFSLEPLLGHIELPDPNVGYKWIIAGGESGLSARPIHPSWVRSIRDECVVMDIPFFFKQWGEYAPSEAKGDCMRKIGKKAAGNLLDNQRWEQFPTALQTQEIKQCV